MTEKRFTLIKDTGTDECYSDNLYDNGTYIGAICGGSEMICYLLNNLNEENQQLKKENHNRKVLLVDELRGLFQMYLTQCRSISEEAIITLIRNDVKKRVFEVFDE